MLLCNDGMSLPCCDNVRRHFVCRHLVAHTRTYFLLTYPVPSLMDGLWGPSTIAPGGLPLSRSCSGRSYLLCKVGVESDMKEWEKLGGGKKNEESFEFTSTYIFEEKEPCGWNLWPSEEELIKDINLPSFFINYITSFS